ncbi:DUF4233 domain-containing protein [Brachybacterium paraconglomeratum]|uniref:DUF4233 domain-containing protein n=1 Tax=Brachybacterium paraconglomeratum TaxID=173362 RepID=UPI0031EF5E68
MRDLDLTPSLRPHGAQRMIASTILVIEAFVVFFAALVAHQLAPEDRLLTWTWSLLAALVLVLCSGLLKRGAWPYWLGLILQLPVILLGIQVTAMWVVGILFAALYAYGTFKGHQLDGEKDTVDAEVWAARAEEPDSTAS